LAQAPDNTHQNEEARKDKEDNRPGTVDIAKPLPDEERRTDGNTADADPEIV